MYFFYSYFEIKIKMLNQHFNIVTMSHLLLTNI